MELIRNGRFGPNPGRGAVWSPILGLSRLQGGYETASMELSRNGRFEPNPGLEPFGARFWDFRSSGPAIELRVWDWAETAILSQMLAGSVLDPTAPGKL